MRNKFILIVLVVFSFALTGCNAVGLIVGGMSPPVIKEYEINGSSFDKAFQMAYRAIEESKLEIYNSNKDVGKIDAGINMGKDDRERDSRVTKINFTTFNFFLREDSPGKMIFSIEAKSSMGGQKYIDLFTQNYGKYVKFAEVSKGSTLGSHDKIEEARMDNTVPSEESNTKEAILSKEEIVQVQIMLKKLGYDPGPPDGIMGGKTLTAIEKFKAENKPITDLRISQ
jgi:hypothetical protein